MPNLGLFTQLWGGPITVLKSNLGQKPGTQFAAVLSCQDTATSAEKPGRGHLHPACLPITASRIWVIPFWLLRVMVFIPIPSPAFAL